MWFEEHESNDEETLEQAWKALQGTPSYVERFQDGRSSIEAKAHQSTWTFCLLCGFWVEDTHQCPSEVPMVS